MIADTHMWIVADAEGNIVLIGAHLFGVKVVLPAMLQSEDDALAVLWAAEQSGKSGLHIHKFAVLLEAV